MFFTYICIKIRKSNLNCIIFLKNFLLWHTLIHYLMYEKGER